MYEFDANLVYMELAQAQKFFEMGDGVTGIEVNLQDIYSAPKLGDRIEIVLGHSVLDQDVDRTCTEISSAP